MTSQFLTIRDKKYNEELDGEFSSKPHDFGFDLDHFQKHAIMAIKRAEHVLVTAHTGSGKTVPAIFAIADSLEKNKKIIYTSPIKSLSNQKLFELSQKFPSVGIMTGDIKFNPDAQCIIMTTEILRNILYHDTSNQGSTPQNHVDIAEIDKVIFDEVHYINDPDRGRVWEECIILMPKEITMIMLSATIDKAHEFASWIGDIKQKTINLIPTTHRVVPLEHFMFLPNNDIPSSECVNHDLVKIVDSKKNFQNYNLIKQHYYQEPTNILVGKLVNFLKEHKKTPALFFVFSRKETERLARGLTKRMVSAEEAGEILRIFNWELRKYKKLYETSRQYHEIEQLIQKGIAYHHSGLVPVLKEVVEILFAKGLIKLLFATETFAVGVNAPTKTVIFPKITKYSNNGFRLLRTDEYLQMAGRAGRRGLDLSGDVILLPTTELADFGILKKMLTGKSPSIQSKFRLNYQFILKIINSSLHDLEAFIKNSLISKDIKAQISADKMLLKTIEDKKAHSQTQFTKEDLTLFKNIKTKERQLLQLRGNQHKKAQIKFNKEVQSIKNYKLLKAKFDKHEELINNINKINASIDACENEINIDIDKMINYLYDNSYITIKAPLDKTPKEQHLLALNKNGFMSNMISLDLKGVIASQISECNEIILTEIITNKHFLDLSGPDIVAVLASFIEEKTCEEIEFKDLKISDNAKQMLDLISYIAEDFGSYEYNSGIDIQSDWKLYLSFVGPAYDWANMVPLHEILAKNSDIYEGTFIRNILRIYNMVENIKNIMEILDQPHILKKLEGIDTILIRDQVTTTSLYIDK